HWTTSRQWQPRNFTTLQETSSSRPAEPSNPASGNSGAVQTVEAVEAEIADVRTTGASVGVNLFAPNPVPINSDAFQAYVSELKVESDALGVDLAGVQSREDDDQWADKVALLLDNPAEKFKDEAVVET
ncbi:MAG: hypothetical protein H0X12_09605, partial [Nocardioides sp.]|nr:hypothetical protein [Nocardioides sp.]